MVIDCDDDDDGDDDDGDDHDDAQANVSAILLQMHL